MGGTCLTTDSKIETQDQTNASSAKCYLVTCMDFRLLDDVVMFMDSQGYNNNYDQFILAGASLGFTQQKFPHWGNTLADHMGIGRDLHDFREIIFIDHIDCGAYSKFYPQIHSEAQERAYHRMHMQMAYEALAKKFPTMSFKGYLMDLQGQCEPVPIKLLGPHQIQIPTEKDQFLANIHESYSHHK